MNLKLSILRRYRFNENHIKILDFVTKSHRNESDFIRSAIIEKFARDFPSNPLNKSPL